MCIFIHNGTNAEMTSSCTSNSEAVLTWTTVMLSRPTVLMEPPYCSCLAACASSWTCCCCWVGVIRRKSCGSSPIYTWKQKTGLSFTQKNFHQHKGGWRKRGLLGAVLREILIHANDLTLYVFFEREKRTKYNLWKRETKSYWHAVCSIAI